MEWVPSQQVGQRMQTRIVGGQEHQQSMYHVLAEVRMADTKRILLIPGKTGASWVSNFFRYSSYLILTSAVTV